MRARKHIPGYRLEINAQRANNIEEAFLFFVVYTRENMHAFGEKGIRVKTNCVPGKRAEMDISYENLKNTECRKKQAQHPLRISPA